MQIAKPMSGMFPVRMCLKNPLGNTNFKKLLRTLPAFGFKEASLNPSGIDLIYRPRFLLGEREFASPHKVERWADPSQ